MLAQTVASILTAASGFQGTVVRLFLSWPLILCHYVLPPSFKKIGFYHLLFSLNACLPYFLSCSFLIEPIFGEVGGEGGRGDIVLVC